MIEKGNITERKESLQSLASFAYSDPWHKCSTSENSEFLRTGNLTTRKQNNNKRNEMNDQRRRLESKTKASAWNLPPTPSPCRAI
jgi:citrate synthase